MKNCTYFGFSFSKNDLLFVYLLVYIYFCIGVFPHVCLGPWRPEERDGLPGSGVTVVSTLYECAMWVLGIKSGPYGRTAPAFNH